MGSAFRRRATTLRPCTCARSAASGSTCASGSIQQVVRDDVPVRANQKFEMLLRIAPLAGNGIRQDHVEGRQAVGGDDEQAARRRWRRRRAPCRGARARGSSGGFRGRVAGGVFKLATINHMQWTGKLIGGALGAFFGPVGLAVGAALGHQYDTGALGGPARPPAEQFFRSTFRIMGHVAKADGRVTEREIEAATVRDAGPAAGRGAGAGRPSRMFTAGKQAGFDLETETGRTALCLPAPIRKSCGCSWRSSCASRWPAATWRARPAPASRAWRRAARYRAAAAGAHGGGTARWRCTRHWRGRAGRNRGPHCRRLPDAGSGRGHHQ